MSHVHVRVHVHTGEMLRWALQAPDVHAAGPQRAPRGRPAEYTIHWVAKDCDENLLKVSLAKPTGQLNTPANLNPTAT